MPGEEVREGDASFLVAFVRRGALARDDGEAGAGAVIVRMLERAGLRDHVVVVTRWYGGKPLGGDRFRHVQEAVRVYLASEGA